MAGLKRYIIGFILPVVFAGCNSLNQHNDGSGVYYRPGESLDKDSREQSVNHRPEKTTNESAHNHKGKAQRKQPSEVNPKSKKAYSSSSDGKKSSDNSETDFNYYPNEGSGENKVYGSSSNYYDYKYTNRIRRFESDLNRSFFSPYNRRSTYGFNSYYGNPSRFQNGLSISAGFGDPGYFNRPYRYSFGSFYDPYDYPLCYGNNFYSGRCGFYDPFRSYQYRYNNFGLGGYAYGYGYPYQFQSSGNNEGVDNRTINRPRNPLGSNYDTDKTNKQQPRQERGQKVKSRQKQKNTDNAKSDNRQYDYYNPDEDRRQSRDYQKKRERKKRDRSQRRNQFDESHYRDKPSRKNRRDPGFNRQNDQQDQFNRRNRTRNENKKRRSPSRDRRKSRSNNDNDNMNRPRR